MTQKPNNADQTRPAGELLELIIAGVPVNFHWAPAGYFLMGSPESEYGLWKNETQHEVLLTQGFWVAETPTTQELWQAVMGKNPSWFTGDKQLPVEQVSWDDCHDFVEQLNRNHSVTLPNGYKYAMPTEAQWEYACRAGTTTPFNFGGSLNGDKANCNGKAPYGTSKKGAYYEKTTPVKSYAPNAWGLYDMHGNVWEWTSDWDDPDYGLSDALYALEETLDPTGSDSGSYRVLRGGSWLSHARNCRSASRYSSTPGDRSISYGFRLALVR